MKCNFLSWIIGRSPQSPQDAYKDIQKLYQNIDSGRASENEIADMIDKVPDAIEAMPQASQELFGLSKDMMKVNNKKERAILRPKVICNWVTNSCDLKVAGTGNGGANLTHHFSIDRDRGTPAYTNDYTHVYEIMVYQQKNARENDPAMVSIEREHDGFVSYDLLGQSWNSSVYLVKDKSSIKNLPEFLKTRTSVARDEKLEELLKNLEENSQFKFQRYRVGRGEQGHYYDQKVFAPMFRCGDRTPGSDSARFERDIIRDFTKKERKFYANLLTLCGDYITTRFLTKAPQQTSQSQAA